MKSKTLYSLIFSLMLMVGHLPHVTAVTDAELEALDKQIEQLEVEEKEQAEAEAKRKVEQKRKAEAEAKRKAEAEAKKQAEEKRLAEEETKRKEEERIAEMERKRKKELELTGEMVVIPAGSFRMGDISGEGDSDEKPVHTVTIKPFKMGKHEVTFNQWDACLADGGCNGFSPKDRGWGRGRRPVFHVIWDDAQSFVNWLNKKTDGGYRLPSEAEWEYAARAGTETEYSWGNDIGHNHANCFNCGSRWDNQTAPVGSFPANAFGLHDMHGNVSELTQDCWHSNYNGAPSDGSVWKGGDCAQNAKRGGGYSYGPDKARSAYRFGLGRRVGAGFRLAQDK